MLVLLVCLVALTVDSAVGKACDRGENGRYKEMKKNMSPEEVEAMEAKMAEMKRLCENEPKECKAHCWAKNTKMCDASGKPTGFGPVKVSGKCKELAEECATKKIAELKETNECKIFNIHKACYKDDKLCPKDSFTFIGKDGTENSEKKE